MSSHYSPSKSQKSDHQIKNEMKIPKLPNMHNDLASVITWILSYKILPGGAHQYIILYRMPDSNIVTIEVHSQGEHIPVLQCKLNHNQQNDLQTNGPLQKYMKQYETALGMYYGRNQYSITHQVILSILTQIEHILDEYQICYFAMPTERTETAKAFPASIPIYIKRIHSTCTYDASQDGHRSLSHYQDTYQYLLKTDQYRRVLENDQSWQILQKTCEQDPNLQDRLDIDHIRTTLGQFKSATQPLTFDVETDR